ncbi:MAG: hypothetical protein KJP00_11855, partial [Bacteroidia bacterium]|nr:hypothetical protein [Bacteroidia bacterium]
MFIGAEFGLFVSFNGGQAWQKWEVELPNTPITDLVIHPRDYDLVIGTFGRSFYILDDIRPLRALASASGPTIVNKDIHVFDIPDTYLWMIGESIGYRFGKVGDSYFNGDNRPTGALISYHASKEGEARFDITDISGDTIRTFYRKAKTGVNRHDWNLRSDAMRAPNQAKPRKESRPGFFVAPGEYTCHVSIGKQSASAIVNVMADPRMPKVPNDQIKEKVELQNNFNAIVQKATVAMDEVRSLQESLEIIEKILDKENTEDETLTSEIENTKKALKKMHERMLGEEKQGIYRMPDVLTSMIRNSQYLLDFVLAPANANQQNMLRLTSVAVDTFITDLANLKKQEMQSIMDYCSSKNLQLF